MLQADVLDVHPGRASRVEEAGQLARAVDDDDLDHGEVTRLAAVLAGDAAGARPAPVERARDAGPAPAGVPRAGPARRRATAARSSATAATTSAKGTALAVRIWVHSALSPAAIR